MFGRYRGNAPLLAVGATDVKTGECVLFDSASATVTPATLAASIAIPILFSPVRIDDRYCWDSETSSTTLLPHVFALLREKLPRRENNGDLRFIVVDMVKAERQGHIESLHIGRDQFEYEYISRNFDYSPEYIARLFAQGTKSALDAYREKQGSDLENEMDPELSGQMRHLADGKGRPAPRLVPKRID